jgi:hypothetical protein
LKAAITLLSVVPRAKKPRKPVESPRLPKSFDKTALLSRFLPRQRPTGIGSWTLESILAARDAQALGRFGATAQLGRQILTDAAIFKAALNRLAPHMGLPRDVCGPPGVEMKGTAESILLEAQATFPVRTSSALPSSVLSDVFYDLAIHELAVCQIQWEVRSDGSRWDPFVTYFDISAVDWDEHKKKLFAETEDGRVEIVHGDGRWIVFQRSADRPWSKAALLPLSLLWADRQFGVRDRSQNAESHGDDKWLGTLPEGVAIDSDEGQAMLEQLVLLYEKRRAMIAPFGAVVKRDEAMGQNWQIFKELIEADGRDAAGILVGQDGTTQNAGGNYIKSWMLYGVRNDIVESDIGTVGSCISTGLLRPWSLINFGKWDRLSFEWTMPDADEDARRESIATRYDRMNKILKESRENGVVVDQAYVNRIASELGLKPPTLAPTPAQAPTSQDSATPGAARYPRSAAA